MRMAIAGGVALCGTLLMSWYGAAQAQQPKPEITETPAIKTLDGPALYNAYCAVCHGLAAKGDGPMAKILTVKTPNLTEISRRHGGKFPRAQIEGIISGENTFAGHGPREMPVWGPVFSQVDRDMDLGRVRVDNLARYLESLQTK